MKTIRNILSVSIIFILATSFTSNHWYPSTDSNTPEAVSEINWKSFDEARKLKNSGKKYFIFVHTDWCSWCTRMENTTFTNEKVVKLLNEEFIPVSFDGESKETIRFKGQEFNYVKSGPRGYHELAGALLNNRLSYPSLVFLDEEMNMIQPLPGYKSPEDLSIILSFLAEEIYEDMTFEQYYNQQTQDSNP